MEVIFLRRVNLQVLDFGYVDSEFQIVQDCVVPQKSSFTVNKQNINASVGDLLVVKDRTVNYIGIIVSMEEDSAKFTTKVETTDFISILDIQVKLSSYSGNISLYLYNLISAAYKTNADLKQRIDYLTINRDYATVTGTLTYEADTIGSISSVVATLNKAYSIGVFYSLDYMNGAITGITLHISDCKRGTVIKSTLAAISNLVVSSDNTQTTNKVVFVPSDENVTYRSTVCYYLLTNGTITTSSTNDLRYPTVCSITKIFKDADYGSLSTTAQSEMLSSSLEHSITFDLRMDNKVLVPFVDLNVGDFVSFIAPTKTYDTMVTKITIKNNLATVNITLGEYRGTLTEKIKLLSKK